MAREIDIDHLTIDELIALGNRVHERIKYLERHEVFQAMQRFNIGARVRVHPGRHGPQIGTLMKFDQKSVNITGDDGRQWRVPADILVPLRSLPTHSTTVAPDIKLRDPGTPQSSGLLGRQHAVE